MDCHGMIFGSIRRAMYLVAQATTQKGTPASITGTVNISPNTQEIRERITRILFGRFELLIIVAVRSLF